MKLSVERSIAYCVLLDCMMIWTGVYTTQGYCLHWFSNDRCIFIRKESLMNWYNWFLVDIDPIFVSSNIINAIEKRLVQGENNKYSILYDTAIIRMDEFFPFRINRKLLDCLGIAEYVKVFWNLDFLQY